MGADLDSDQAARVGFVVHRALGMIYGVAAATIATHEAPPLRAGVAAGAAGFVVVDEGVNAALFTPPPRAYPLESHMRGVVGDLAYGLAAGSLLAVARRLTPTP